jgi:hypothetical protein
MSIQAQSIGALSGRIYLIKSFTRSTSERNEDLRAEFRIRMGDYYTPQLVFLDETSKDDRTFYCTSGRAAIGKRAIEPSPFIRGDNYSLLPAMSVDGIFAASVVKGSFNRARFYSFLEDGLVCDSYYSYLLTNPT